MLDLAPLFGSLPLPTIERNLRGTPTIGADARFLSVAVLAVVYPLLLGYFVNRDQPFRFLRSLGLANMASRPNAWLEAFARRDCYVIVNLTGERRIYGWPRLYSASGDEGLLYLEQPSWVNDDGSLAELPIDGILLLDRPRIESIEFLR